jgi:hypothetical protein
LNFKIKKTFKEFYEDFVKEVLESPNKEYLLKETPLYTGLYNNFLNNPLAKRNRLENIKNFDKEIESWNGFSVYKGDSITKGGEDYSFVYNDSLLCTFSIRKLKDNGIEILSVWNDPYDGKNLARQIIFDYFFQSYKYIMCGESHTEQGKQFWYKIIKQALQKNIKCFLVDLNKNTEIPIFSETEQIEYDIYGNDKGYLRLKITK